MKRYAGRKWTVEAENITIKTNSCTTVNHFTLDILKQ